MDSVSRDIVDTCAGFARSMSELKPDMKVRYLVASWPEESPRGAVAAFCREHNVSRSWFYKVRAAAVSGGPAQAMAMRSTKPRTSPNATPAGVTALALHVRETLEAQGHDHGPLSVQARMRRDGVEPPSRATLARLFTKAGMVVQEPRKKPRSAYRRFVYPAPNCCWQIDATEWQLENGVKVVIFQLIDDYSRLALASLVAAGETSEAALRVVKHAISKHGVPRKFLSDNGMALNPTRRGRSGALVDYLRSLGVEPITGKPYKPTTQGKNERFHRTLHRFLHKQKPASTIEDLQAQVDNFDHYYNTEREHQALPARMTPQQAWEATEKVPAPSVPVIPEIKTQIRRTVRRTVSRLGVVTVVGTHFQVGRDRAGETIHIVYDAQRIMFFDGHGTEIISHPRPPRGTKYMGNNKPRGFMANQVSTTS